MLVLEVELESLVAVSEKRILRKQNTSGGLPYLWPYNCVTLPSAGWKLGLTSCT